MKDKETQRLIELIRCLSEKKKREFYYMALGAAFAATNIREEVKL